MVLIMFDGLHDIDWASMEHAYGSAEEVPALLWALRSPDAEERHKALNRFYGAVHHQGSVYPSTAASLPFLFELAADDATPERAAVVAGEEAFRAARRAGMARVWTRCPAGHRSTPAAHHLVGARSGPDARRT
ncbi:hypothetical protein [Streptomyces sp. NPDC001500]